MKKEDSSPNRKSFSLKERFSYWFDNRMTRGSLGLIKVLIIVSIILAVLIGFLIVFLGFSGEKSLGEVIWSSIVTLINAWMPEFDEESTIGYLVFMTIAAIAGVLFTSVLIGIITSAIEEKIDSLKRGNSRVLETGHIVVLGFYPGEYTLLNQLILAAAGNPACVVIAENMEREEMEQDIRENLEIPKNFRIICRTADITDPASLEKCSVETCKTIIISPTDDTKTIKAVLAATVLLEEKGVPEISINAIISKNEFRIPPSLAEANNITTLSTNSILAKMIAHSCTQTGLSESFREIFNFEGSEFYLINLPGISGLTFEDLMVRLDNAVPVGVFRDGKVLLNPAYDYLLEENDKILVFAENSDSATFVNAESFDPKIDLVIPKTASEDLTDTVIIGNNETLPIILREMPENVSRIHLVGVTANDDEQEELQMVISERNLNIQYYQGNLRSEKFLNKLARMAGHIVILSDHDKDPEEADMAAILLLMNLRDIRSRYNLSFNLTVEMQKEHNQRLVSRGDHTDFLVSSSMSSLILAQLAESPELIDVFREILSNTGNELYLKSIESMHLTGCFSICDLRQCMLRNGYILLGYLDAEKNSCFNLSLDQKLTLTAEDYLIVLGEI